MTTTTHIRVPRPVTADVVEQIKAAHAKGDVYVISPLVASRVGRNKLRQSLRHAGCPEEIVRTLGLATTAPPASEPAPPPPAPRAPDPEPATPVLVEDDATPVEAAPVDQPRRGRRRKKKDE